MIAEKTKQYISDWDPLDFIKEDGAPSDEYHGEAEELYNWFKKNPDIDNGQLAFHTHELFVEWTEIDPEGFSDECYTRADELKKVLQIDLETENSQS